METFEEKFQKAVAEGLEHRGVIKLFRTEWVEALREKMVLRTLKQAQVFLEEKGYEAEADKDNGTRVYLKWDAHELTFDFDHESGKIICASSIEELNERYDVPTASKGSKGFNTLCVQDKLIAFGRAVAALIDS